MKEIETALQSNAAFEVFGQHHLKSCFSVSELAASSIGAVGSAIANLLQNAGLTYTAPRVLVDQKLASLWFAQSIYPIRWQLPPVWDSISGLYKTSDGWIRLHTNLDHHRAAASKVLGTKEIKEAVTAAISNWNAEQLELEIVTAGGVAAAMRTRNQWQAHPQGKALATEPLLIWDKKREVRTQFRPKSSKRPLQGLKVLDLTRVLAGPVATRALAGFGANVLRIDPPNWDEPNVVPDITLGKRCARLRLTEKPDRDIFENLLASADVLVHGYRPGALDGLGYGTNARQAISPNLIEVSLNAYGWSGPLSGRRGFDSLVQMSSGIAATGMQWANQTRPLPLPVQALDHATGYLMAAAVIRATSDAICKQHTRNARLSLARTAELLIAYPQTERDKYLNLNAQQEHFSNQVESTPWGKANRLKSPLAIDGVKIEWALSANNLGTFAPKW